MVMGAISRGEIKGVLIRMGNSTRNIDIKASTVRPPASYDGFLSDADVAMAASHPTDLNALSSAAFDRLARHGYETANQTLSAYAPGF
jgi:NTE family protein